MVKRHRDSSSSHSHEPRSGVGRTVGTARNAAAVPSVFLGSFCAGKRLRVVAGHVEDDVGDRVGNLHVYRGIGTAADGDGIRYGLPGVPVDV